MPARFEIVAHRRDAHATVFSLRVDGRNAEVVTLSVRLTRPPVRMVALVLRADARVVPAARPATTSGLRRAVTPLDGEAYSYATMGPHGQPELRYRFRVTFKDTTTLRRGLHFDVFADWMGRIRELATVTIADCLVADFASGEWGMVTNHSNIQIVGDASSLDLIEGRMHVVRAYGQFGSWVDLHFEWVAIRRDGLEHPVATSEMTTTWVKILEPRRRRAPPVPRVHAGAHRLLSAGARGRRRRRGRAGPAPGAPGARRGPTSAPPSTSLQRLRGSSPS